MAKTKRLKGEGHRCGNKALKNSSWRKKNMLHNKLGPLIPNPLSTVYNKCRVDVIAPYNV
jgi:hypothetical protein